MTTEKAYINGFIKRAADYGVNPQQALNILKQADAGQLALPSSGGGGGALIPKLQRYYGPTRGAVNDIVPRSSIGGMAGRAIGGLGAGMGAMNAYNRFQDGDYTGAAIDGVGALGSAASLIPHPVARGIGTAASVGAMGLNAHRDGRNKSQTSESPQQAEPGFSSAGGGSWDTPNTAVDAMNLKKYQPASSPGVANTPAQPQQYSGEAAKPYGGIRGGMSGGFGYSAESKPSVPIQQYSGEAAQPYGGIRGGMSGGVGGGLGAVAAPGATTQQAASAQPSTGTSTSALQGRQIPAPMSASDAFKPQALSLGGPSQYNSGLQSPALPKSNGPSDAQLAKIMGSYDPRSRLDQAKAQRIRELYSQGTTSPNAIYADRGYSSINPRSIRR